MWRPERPPGGQGGQLGGAKCGIPGNGAQVLYSSHKDPELRCPPSGPTGFGLTFSLGEELGTAKDEGPRGLSGGDGLGQGTRQGCMWEMVGSREASEQWRGGPGAERGPGLAAGRSPRALVPWSCLTPWLRIPPVPSQRSAALPPPPLAQASGEADLQEDRRVILSH